MTDTGTKALDTDPIDRHMSETGGVCKAMDPVKDDDIGGKGGVHSYV